MTARRTLAAVVAVLLTSLPVAVSSGEDAVVSIRIWLTASVIGITLVLVVRLVDVAAVESFRAPVAWTRRAHLRRASHSGVAALRATEALMINGPEDVRIHVQRLRPRLIELALHHLPPERFGDTTPEGPTSALGDVAWMIDPTVDDRAPTLDEIDRFLDRVTALGGPVSP